MKKIVIILVTSSLFFAQVSCTEPQRPSPSYEYVSDLCKGFIAGMVATWAVETSRNHLPDITHWNLHGVYGICRDRLEGRVGVAAAGLGLAAAEGSHFSNFKKRFAQISGILMGACAANYVSKLALVGT